MTELDKEKQNLPSAMMAAAISDAPAAPTETTAKDIPSPTQQKSSAELAHEKHLQELRDNRFEKKGARRAFHLINFLGLHQIFNNATSVVITFVMATTGLANKMKNSMANGPGKYLSAVLTAPNKVVNFAFKLCGMDFNKEIEQIQDPTLKANKLKSIAQEANRNAIETSFMTIAGFIALMPVYILERHRAGFMNKVDNWLHPGRTPEEKKAAALTVEDEPKETLWNLFRARIIALAAVFGIDQIRTNFDRILRERHTDPNTMYKNVESVAGWRFGDWIYRNIGEKSRNWIARFFSGSLDILPERIREWFTKASGGTLQENNLLLSKMQDETRGDALKFTKAPDFVHRAGERIADINDKIQKGMGNKEVLEARIARIESAVQKRVGGSQAVERAVFAEQSRLFFTKEVFLTTILSAIIYYCAKSPTALKFMEKIGLAKKGSYEKEHAKLEARRHAKQHKSAPEIERHVEEPGKFAEAVGQRKALAEPAASYTDKVAAQSETQPQAAL